MVTAAEMPRSIVLFERLAYASLAIGVAGEFLDNMEPGDLVVTIIAGVWW